MLTTLVVCAALTQLPPLTPKTVDEYLPALQSQEPDYLERVETIAKAFLGVAYAKDPLGEGPNAPYDDDPLIDLLHVDEVTFVEQCLALAAASSLEEATRDLATIRYIAGEVDYARRNHLLVADWVINNTFVENITHKLGVTTRPVMRFIERKEIFENTKAYELFKDRRTEGITIHYIGLDDLDAAIPKIPDNSFIIFVSVKSASFGGHCGLYFTDDQGQGVLYHASPLQQHVVATSLKEAVNHGDAIGLLVYKLHPERMAIIEAPAADDDENEDSETEEAPPADDAG